MRCYFSFPAEPPLLIQSCACRKRRVLFASKLRFMVRFEAVLLQLSIKRRAANTEFAGHGRHLAAMMGQSEFDRRGLQLIERTRMAAGIEEWKDVWVPQFHPDELSRRTRRRSQS